MADPTDELDRETIRKQIEAASVRQALTVIRDAEVLPDDAALPKRRKRRLSRRALRFVIGGAAVLAIVLGTVVLALYQRSQRGLLPDAKELASVLARHGYHPTSAEPIEMVFTGRKCKLKIYTRDANDTTKDFVTVIYDLESDQPVALFTWMPPSQYNLKTDTWATRGNGLGALRIFAPDLDPMFIRKKSETYEDVVNGFSFDVQYNDEMEDPRLMVRLFSRTWHRP